MEKELAERQELGLVQLAESFAKSNAFKDLKNKDQALVTILGGRELGLAPLYSMQHIFIVNGRLSIDSQTMANLIKRSKIYKVDILISTIEKCELDFYEKEENLEGKMVWVKQNREVVSFTIADAKRAGLLTKDNWIHYPAEMLYARALSKGARRYCPDAIGGFYTNEELEGETQPTNMQVEIVPDIPMTKVQKETIEAIINEMPKNMSEDLTVKYATFSEAQAKVTIDWWETIKNKPDKIAELEKGLEPQVVVPENNEPEPLTKDQLPMIENARKSRYLQFANVSEQAIIKNAKTKEEGMAAINLWYNHFENGVEILGLRDQLRSEHPELETPKPKKEKPAKVAPESSDIVKLYDKLVARKMLCKKCKSEMIPKISDDGTLSMNPDEDCYWFVCKCGNGQWVLA